MKYEFKFNDKEYELNNENIIELINDEENPIEGLDENKILELLSESDKVDFQKAYYDTPCEVCNENFKEKKSISEYLEYYFYVYSKDGKYVISNISKEYEGLTYNRLELEGKVDNSYIVTVIVCANCSHNIIQIEELEV